MIKHDITAEFSCSLDSQGNFKQYKVVAGSSFSSEYSETLDSAILVLDHIKKEDRLFNIKPYDFVHIYDTLKSDFDYNYLVDNFAEREENIKEHIFSYTINLMSETKLLEKIQCPNLAITHKLNSDGSVNKLTIYEHIRRYIELYSPKIKMAYTDYSSSNWNIVKWRYEKLIKIAQRHNITMSLSFIRQGNNYVCDAYYNLDELTANPEFNILSAEFTRDINLSVKTLTVENGQLHFHGVSSTLPEVSSLKVSFEYCSKADALYQRFDVSCADLGMTSPTLRQLLTTLMQQVGCIPTLKHRALGFLDFNVIPKRFGTVHSGVVDYTCDYTVSNIQRSLSSDSFVNTLVNVSSGVLDSENEVICETLGFRDKQNFILKQTSNLNLETKFPIYKVNEFKLSSYIVADVSVSNIRNSGQFTPTGTRSYAQISIDIDHTEGERLVTLDFQLTLNQVSGDEPIRGVNIAGQLVAFSYNKKPQIFNFSRHGITDEEGGVFTFNLDSDKADYDLFYYYGTMTVYTNVSGSEKEFEQFYASFANRFSSEKTIAFWYKQDITPLLLENSVRSTLDRDFASMQHSPATTIEELARYRMGTVGYTIGSKVISGFSEVYSVGEQEGIAWIVKDYTYIENIFNFLINHYQTEIKRQIVEYFGNIPIIDDPTYGENISLSNIKPFNPEKTTGATLEYLKEQGIISILTSDINFSYLVFDIKYQPLNSFNLSFVKSQEDIPFSIEQYDGNAGGMTDFDRLSIHEQEQVDRIGNEALSISQRTEEYSKIQCQDENDNFVPAIFLDDKNRDGDWDDPEDEAVEYTIFKRTFTVSNYNYDVAYTGSKDAILKNYFTSIRTKYRAYQYVDYESSVLRKEKDVVYVLLSEKGYFDGDDKVWLGGWNESISNQIPLQICFLGSWKIGYLPYDNEQNITYVMNKSLNQDDEEEQIKNDISKIYNSNSFGIIYEEPDNVGNGTYIGKDYAEESLEYITMTLGGVAQSWQIWNEDEYNEKHAVYYVSNIDLASILDDYVEIDVPEEVEEFKTQFANILKMPIVGDIFVDPADNSTNNMVLSVVNRKVSGLTDKFRYFYKDLAEVINHTVEFIYYSDSKNIKWGEEFIRLNNLSSKSTVLNIGVLDISDENFEMNNFEYKSDKTFYQENIGNAIEFYLDNGAPCILVDWSILKNHVSNDITQFKIVKSIGTGANRTFKDILAFKKGETDYQKFYLSLNDTKSEYVLAEKNGILYKKYKVARNTSERNVVNIYNE